MNKEHAHGVKPNFYSQHLWKKLNVLLILYYLLCETGSWLIKIFLLYDSSYIYLRMWWLWSFRRGTKIVWKISHFKTNKQVAIIHIFISTCQSNFYVLGKHIFIIWVNINKHTHKNGDKGCQCTRGSFTVQIRLEREKIIDQKSVLKCQTKRNKRLVLCTLLFSLFQYHISKLTKMFWATNY